VFHKQKAKSYQGQRHIKPMLQVDINA